MANAAEAMMWAAVFAPSADEIAESIVRKEELRRSEEELRKTERQYKQNVIAWLRDGSLKRALTRAKDIDPEATPIYSHISAEQEADMLESGELVVVFLYKKEGGFDGFFVCWADETREEAQNPLYIERKKYFDELVSQEDMRARVC